MVVFGANGSGKSSFVDGVETCLNGGKVGHLSHEYSGRNQEKGLINVARPPTHASSVTMVLSDGSKTRLEWTRGAAVRNSEGSTNVGDWDCSRTVLRQEDLSAFIRSTKREKYSSVLPLLGLSDLEATAENLDKLAKQYEKKSGLQG